MRLKHDYQFTVLWVRCCLILALFQPVFCSPLLPNTSARLPEVVYPKKSQSNNLWTNAAVQNGVSKGKSTNNSAKNSGNTSYGMPVGPVHKARRKTYAQKQYISTKEARIVLAPLEGEKVYTLEKYVVVSSEQPERQESTKRPKGPKAAVAAVKTKANVQELVALKRTTMSEYATSTTDKPSLVIGEVRRPVSAESEEKQPKNLAPPAYGSNVHLVSHDTSNSAEIKYPAKSWQLPPALLAARLKKSGLDTARELNSVEDENLEEALELFSKANDKHNHLMSMGPRSKNISMVDVLQKAFGETKPKPQMTFVDRQKFRATFATHKSEAQQIIPLPPAPFGDETDMDLIQESLRRQGQLPIQPVPIQTNPSIAVPGPLSALTSPLSPLLSAFAPVPPAPYNQNVQISPVVSGATTSSGLDPNHKLDLCCRKQGVNAVCQAMCNFDTFTDRSLVTAVISNQCPGPQLGQAFDCASSKVDHTDCCTRNNVHLHNAGQCMPFCRTHEPTPPNVFTYVACLQVFDTIKNCYREYQYQHPNIFGD
ncbi:unnamed protein product [Bursaphelenchus okinawaensis]|uniref:Domain of unknown function DB domain-containing protein n=1 Tax=Bursaphelenchus okinawaensis TaxID=465554 RepID=A0A811K2U0_9BILA|nr:unnamed protein product [Bursaphelenchus okinawaensis]CAG9090516.1 unnamed protein product [Bursaphelenchus okinawaensis]